MKGTRFGHTFLVWSCQEAEESLVGLCGRKVKVEGEEPKMSSGGRWGLQRW